MKWLSAAVWIGLASTQVQAAAVIAERATTTSSSTALSRPASTSTTTSKTPDPSCTNGPTTRQCWKNGYSIAQDPDLKWPNTGVVRSYKFEITNGTCAPDGVKRYCALINGQFPGPTITADWGDTISINVKNSLHDNGTSIHWHGMRQLNSTFADGVNGVTECPIAPGQNETYTFLATLYGTSWYHSHFTVQYGDGVVGSMVINGPASANYDVDLGPYPITDWFHTPAFTTFAREQIAANHFQGGPDPDNVLINGTNAPTTTVVSGKKYRLRLINTSVDNFLRVSLDNHTFQVIAQDLIPTQPFSATTLVLGAGQRYDVVVTANQTAGSYYFRADAAGDCQSGNAGHGRGIWTYSTVSPSTPANNPWPVPSNCSEPDQNYPYWNVTIPSNAKISQLNLTAGETQVTPGGPDNVVVWQLGGTNIDIDWANPTLSYVMSGNTSYPTTYNVLPVAPAGGWNYWVIQQTANIPALHHPIHLHGHNYYVIGRGNGTFDAGTAKLNYINAPRKDTTILPAGGWLAIAYKSDNPGTWLMHCHIAWHISEGFGAQFVESPNSINLPDKSKYGGQCQQWKNYYVSSYFAKEDSGLYGNSEGH